MVWGMKIRHPPNYLSAPTQAPTRYAEVGNRVEVGDEEEAETKRRQCVLYPIWFDLSHPLFSAEKNWGSFERFR
jgi:hypothetical protein